MPFSRLANRVVFKNKDLLYDEKFKDRGLNGITQYNTDTIVFPSSQETARMSYDTRLWQAGDRLYKIAFEVYGDSRYWWVIAQFNKKPTEHHFKVGDTYYIPLNLEDALNSFGY